MQIELYRKFQTSHPKIIIGQRLFEFLKPFFGKPLKDRNTCCIYHVKLNELRLALNLLRTKSLVHDLQVCN